MRTKHDRRYWLVTLLLLVIIIVVGIANYNARNEWAAAIYHKLIGQPPAASR